VSYSIQWHPHGAYKKFDGAIKMAELLESLTRVQCHPDYDKFQFTITDFLDAKYLGFSESELMLYGAHVLGGEYVNKKLLVGIVATDPEILHLLRNSYEPLVRYLVGYFSTVNACESWVSEKTGIAVEFRRN